MVMVATLLEHLLHAQVVDTARQVLIAAYIMLENQGLQQVCAAVCPTGHSGAPDGVSVASKARAALRHLHVAMAPDSSWRHMYKAQSIEVSVCCCCMSCSCCV